MCIPNSKTKVLTDPEYLELTNKVLGELKDAINSIAEREGKSVEEFIPTYPEWMKKECELVKEKHMNGSSN